MSNIKRVRIEGQLPFNFIEEARNSGTKEGHELVEFMARFMQPSFGLRLEWLKMGGKEKWVANDYGGKTAVYEFVVVGVEALSREWFKGFVRSVRAVPFGEIFTGIVIDEEEVKDKSYNVQEFVLSEILRLEFGGYWKPQEEIRVRRELKSHTFASTPPNRRKAIADAAAEGLNEIERRK